VPIYEYRCPRCGHQFEIMHAVDAEPPKCERCGRAVKRVFTPVGIIFKGSGWHITDYRKTPAPADGEAKEGHTAPSDGKKTDAHKADGKKTGAAAAPSSGAGSTSKTGGGGSST
jgi:putative FmdB family regulatory protein